MLFCFLPIIGMLSYPLSYITEGFIGMVIVAAFILGLGMFVWRGSARALTFAIFLNGMNVIVRLMMLLSTVISKQGIINVQFGIAGMLGLIISFYIMLRLDQTDVRKYIESKNLGSKKSS